MHSQLETCFTHIEAELEFIVAKDVVGLKQNETNVENKNEINHRNLFLEIWTRECDLGWMEECERSRELCLVKKIFLLFFSQ